MEKFSKKAAAALNRENLQVINSDVWHDLQDPTKLRCEFYWLDEHDEPITVEVSLYKLRQTYDKVGLSCINLVCPSGAFIQSAIQIDKSGIIGLELDYEPLILKGEFNAEALCETNVIVTYEEIIAVKRGIVKIINSLG